MRQFNVKQLIERNEEENKEVLITKILIYIDKILIFVLIVTIYATAVPNIFHL